MWHNINNNKIFLKYKIKFSLPQYLINNNNNIYNNTNNNNNNISSSYQNKIYIKTVIITYRCRIYKVIVVIIFFKKLLFLLG
jgi:hypothetical protein